MTAAARKWWPVDYADEVMPPGRDTPDGFIIMDNGRPMLGYALDEMSVTDRERDYLNKSIQVGEIVNFVCCDDLGEVVVEINADGSFIAQGPVPEQATSFMEIGNPNSLAESLPSYAQNVAELLRGDPPDSWPVVDRVRMACWSDEIPHKLTHAASGLHFEQVSAAEARQ